MQNKGVPKIKKPLQNQEEASNEKPYHMKELKEL
jgi:hypothetical protein